MKFLKFVDIREKYLWANHSMTIFQSLKSKFPDIEMEYYQSNIEGELINKFMNEVSVTTVS